ncbi:MULTISPECIES: ImmA/IrrE family metallo-endopeptidase [unclassified Streptococcus]|uniref:ImmA/IrrE family metallo-endopeptidase n=1 Tax=unclassified Streptococcus TaxID=2608887 RepID=UPI0010205A36|nr:MULTISPECIES: ImmA/IrrE family metallo-endopeptidase [unclassified Streptococcus]MTQ42585.1 ImmA/IrrE family metallo-endopeptidase [Streptococcus sp. BIOML-A1]RYS59425.1 ImmA/IrrE family metallo-endopeptidase [Streptococcus sp. bf_0095]
MDQLYSNISTVTKEILYKFIIDNNIGILNYHFNYFLNFYIEEYDIQVTSHHFSNSKIEGLTIIDVLGVSISYEKTNPKVKRNFTLCHELGHLILNHEGSYFTESIDNQGNILEREANIFSAVVLMPDIVLLSKIYYNCETFQSIQDSLEVSRQALYFRLLDLFRVYFPDKESVIKSSIDSYINGQNASLLLLFHNIKESIIQEFNQYKPSLLNQIKRKISNDGFATSQDIPELLNQKKWNQLKKENPNLKIWLIYNKGKSIAYVWDSRKLSDKEAKKKAELKLLLI